MLCGRHVVVPHTAGTKHGCRCPPRLPCRRCGTCVSGALGGARSNERRHVGRTRHSNGQDARGRKRVYEKSLRQEHQCRWGRESARGSRYRTSKAASQPSRRPSCIAVPCGGARQRCRAAGNKQHGRYRGTNRARVLTGFLCTACSAGHIVLGNRGVGRDCLPPACDGGSRRRTRGGPYPQAHGGMCVLGCVCNAAPARDGRGATHSPACHASVSFRACHGGTRGTKRPPGPGHCSACALRRYMLCAHRARHPWQRLGDTGIFPYGPRNKRVGNVGEPSVFGTSGGTGSAQASCGALGQRRAGARPPTMLARLNRKTLGHSKVTHEGTYA